MYFFLVNVIVNLQGHLNITQLKSLFWYLLRKTIVYHETPVHTLYDLSHLTQQF